MQKHQFTTFSIGVFCGSFLDNATSFTYICVGPKVKNCATPLKRSDTNSWLYIYFDINANSNIKTNRSFILNKTVPFLQSTIDNREFVLTYMNKSTL